MEVVVSGSQMIIGLVVGIICLIFMVMKTKVHAFLALIIAACITGLIGGMPPNSVVSSITGGFGGTLGSIGIIIGFGVMMGQLFEVSGAAEKMAKTFIKSLGKDREELALALTGFIVSIPIFCDSGFVILSPLVKAISKKTKKSAISLGVALAVGLVITHTVVPPTPGPVGVAGLFGVSVGSLLLWGIVLAIPMTMAGMLYGQWIGKKIYQLPSEDGEEWVRVSQEEIAASASMGNSAAGAVLGGNGVDMEDTDDKNLPSAFMSFAPILLPVLLILFNTVGNTLKLEGTLMTLIGFLGQPVIAVGIGLLVAIYGLTSSDSRRETLEKMEDGIKSAGIIILVTGGGGALGAVLRDSGAGNHIAQLIAASAIPAILLPFVVSTLVRFIQGSGTVAMITAASITAPMITTLDVNPVFAALAACVGAVFFGYFNDSYFWVVNRMLGIKEAKEQIRVWSITTTISWAVGIITLLILNAIWG
ncbi:GntP family permease [Clostridium formicaceticum]|uniref:Gluconate permease n=1 Tax=Clostridium formicaceticum TaxID=1497 RepID=A0AAC9WF03_9CLOT|nr:GntP family permease [Clostridium formicaceticum]AOY75864.1 gluconate permease [Clostridium formicaceticum]ARE86203.1 Inner membrane permease YgbN [Clostridium formicaceticum]